MFIFSREMKLQVLRQLLDTVTSLFDVPSAYEFQKNRCTRNPEMLGICEIQFSIRSMWL